MTSSLSVVRVNASISQVLTHLLHLYMYVPLLWSSVRNLRCLKMYYCKYGVSVCEDKFRLRLDGGDFNGGIRVIKYVYIGMLSSNLEMFSLWCKRFFGPSGQTKQYLKKQICNLKRMSKIKHYEYQKPLVLREFDISCIDFNNHECMDSNCMKQHEAD